MPMPTFALCLGRRHCSCRLPECFLNVVKAWALGLGRCAQCVRILLEAGADLNVTNKSERTALSRASYNGRVDVVRLLPAAGAVVDAEDTSGNSTLGQCCAGHQCGPQQVECAKVLIEAGASPAHLKSRWRDLYRPRQNGRCTCQGPRSDATGAGRERSKLSKRSLKNSVLSRPNTHGTFYWPVQRGELQGVWVCVVLCIEGAY